MSQNQNTQDEIKSPKIPKYKSILNNLNNKSLKDERKISKRKPRISLNIKIL